MNMVILRAKMIYHIVFLALSFHPSYITGALPPRSLANSVKIKTLDGEVSRMVVQLNQITTDFEREINGLHVDIEKMETKLTQDKKDLQGDIYKNEKDIGSLKRETEKKDEKFTEDITKLQSDSKIMDDKLKQISESLRLFKVASFEADEDLKENMSSLERESDEMDKKFTQNIQNLLSVTTGLVDISKLKKILGNIGFVINKSRREIYVAFETNKTRKAAEGICNEIQMELVSIETLDENEFILQFIKEKFVIPYDIWIGAKKITQEGNANEGKWQWNDAPYAWTAKEDTQQYDGVFQNWSRVRTTDPDTFAVFSHKDGKWITGEEKEEYSFVCQKEI